MSWNDTTGGVHRLNTFDEVARKYANTDPIVSKHHTKEDDIRPLGRRRYKFRRIVKISDNCYALLSSSENLFHIWTMERGQTQWRRTPDPKFNSLEDYRRCAAVLWTKRRDGSEIVRIRNAPYSHATGHYTFLASVLPSGVTFRKDRNGKHTIRVLTADHTRQELWLPHSKVAGKAYIAEYDPDNSRTDRFNPREDNRYITLRRMNGDTWEVLHDCGKAPKVLRKKVVKDEKAPYDKAFREFMKWARTMAPLLRPTEEARDAWTQEAKEYCGVTTWSTVDGALHKLDVAERRAILTQEDHPMRVPLLGAFLYEDCKTQTQYGYIRATKQYGTIDTGIPTYAPEGRWARFRTEVNELMEFMKKEEPKT